MTQILESQSKTLKKNRNKCVWNLENKEADVCEESQTELRRGTRGVGEDIACLPSVCHLSAVCLPSVCGLAAAWQAISELGGTGRNYPN